MGEYADMENDRLLHEYLDDFERWQNGCPILNDFPIDDFTMDSFIPHKKTLHDIGFVDYDFKKVVRETNKSWLLKMSGNAEQWFSKKYCRIDKTINKVIVPEWLKDKMIQWAVEKGA